MDLAGRVINFINLTLLSIFRRYGFFAMYGFRVAYYMIWHIIWGYIRLQVFA